MLHNKETQVRQEFASNYGTIQWYVRHSADMMRELKYITENRLTNASSGLDVLTGMMQAKHPSRSLRPCFRMATVPR